MLVDILHDYCCVGSLDHHYYRITTVLASCLLGSWGGGILPVFAQADELMEPSLPREGQPPTTSKTKQLQELLRQGLQYVRLRDYANAIAIYQQAVRIDQSNAKLFGGIGYLLARQGRFPEAIQAYQSALSIDPNDPDFYDGLGYSYARAGNNANAITAYSSAITLDPKNVKYHLGLGVVLLREKDYPRVFRLYKEVLALDSKNAEAVVLMGSSLVQQQLWDESINFLQSAIPHFPKRTELSLQLAIAYINKGENQEAEKLLTQILRQNPSNLTAKFQLSQIQEKDGRLENTTKKMIP